MPVNSRAVDLWSSRACVNALCHAGRRVHYALCHGLCLGGPIAPELYPSSPPPTRFAGYTVPTTAAATTTTTTTTRRPCPRGFFRIVKDAKLNAVRDIGHPVKATRRKSTSSATTWRGRIPPVCPGRRTLQVSVKAECVYDNEQVLMFGAKRCQ